MKTINQSQEKAILDNFVKVVKAPYGDFSAIGKLSDALNDPDTLQKIVTFISQTPQGEQAFVDRPLLGKVDLQQLYELPHNTFGHTYAKHMISNKLTPPPAREITSSPSSFVQVHIRETHDIWHVVTGCDTDKPGEVQLEAFYTAQLAPAPLFPSLIAKNLLKTAMYEVELSEQIMDGLTQGWIMGKRAKPVFGIQWNKLWSTSLKDLRASLNIVSI